MGHMLITELSQQQEADRLSSFFPNGTPPDLLS